MASVTSMAMPGDPAAAHRLSEARIAWMLALPAIVLLFLFVLLPVVAVIILGFTDFELGYGTFRFVGLENYADLITDRTFRRSLWNTAVYTAIVAPVSICLGLAIAMLIESETAARSFFRTAYFLPVASLIVAMATVWQYMFHPTIGPLNGLLSLVGLSGPNWLGSSGTVLYSLSIIGVWQSVGFNMVLFLAGLTAIPRELYAAAEVDGARSAVDRFFLVTWPMLGPTTLFVITISITNAVKVFETVKTLTEGGPNKASEVLLFTIYQEGFVYLRVGYASAMTVVFLAILVVLMFLQYRLLDRRVHYT
ncbi:sugar ABC transporter permease [Rhizobium sp. SEMIA 4085]|uniref:Sugar ABC transporter permease protein n=1 Tax=Rhizobium gallicum bv. gallicum R602sp TaxID=1041138 RepID=A0A0B4XDU9_9HYPH|nr:MULTISPECIES: sugar ABC transporter permease [Rhizobium]AJD46184.1 sugar ABC transporter permease protein [Rhizobium gallicum bv. gallicum R602sp]NNH28542.1 sugar ABC transporter permease [Rhizobium sp. SEMIA 4085]TDW32401.1 carbohydrate ABC transporter membrane protein 1 (CUT1 family) [Rhizobium azibense]